MNGGGRTIQVEIPPSTVEAIDTYRQRMLELIGVELTESQVAAMLIHFGKEVAVGRDGSRLLPAGPTVVESDAPAARRQAIATRAKVNRCACGCGQKSKPGNTWAMGHHKRGRAKNESEPETEVVWDGRGPLTRSYDRAAQE